MEKISIEKLKGSRYFIENIRWDVTPKIFLDPKPASGEAVDITHGFMLYVDLIEDKPTLLIIELKPILCKTVGYIHDIPVELLKESMHCEKNECIGGMYPLAERLNIWLKKEFGLN